MIYFPVMSMKHFCKRIIKGILLMSINIFSLMSTKDFRVMKIKQVWVEYDIFLSIYLGIYYIFK